LSRAVVNQKDIPDYKSIWDKSKIYVLNEYLTKEPSELTSAGEGREQFEPNEVPMQIGDIRFSLKTKEELQTIANRSGQDFMFLAFRAIIIDGDEAIVWLSNSWMVKERSKHFYTSGGYYKLQFRKNRDKWEIVKILESWGA